MTNKQFIKKIQTITAKYSLAKQIALDVQFWLCRDLTSAELDQCEVIANTPEPRRTELKNMLIGV